MRNFIQKFDSYAIKSLGAMEVIVARAAIFVVYFWFGFLKLFGLSPAGVLVHNLFDKTIGFVSFPVFYLSFSIFEMAIGLVFLFRGLERVAIFLISIHLIMTALPLIFLPDSTWQKFLVPTLEGQYIIKNILIAVAAVVVGSKLIPISKK